MSISISIFFSCLKIIAGIDPSHERQSNQCTSPFEYSTENCTLEWLTNMTFGFCSFNSSKSKSSMVSPIANMLAPSGRFSPLQRALSALSPFALKQMILASFIADNWLLCEYFLVVNSSRFQYRPDDNVTPAEWLVGAGTPLVSPQNTELREAC
jgi:hypothetical protein